MNGLPTIVGTIERRLLVNYRVDGDVLARLVPAPFRPELIDGTGMAGICLIRLGQLRPRGVPASLGIRTENAAHRIAIEWDDSRGTHRGVFIPRRDTDSRLTTIVGGRIFPGEHSHADFDVHESGQHFGIGFETRDGEVRVSVSARICNQIDARSRFGSLSAASDFFEYAPVGFSSARQLGCYDGLELRTRRWSMEPMQIENVKSSFFEDISTFPPGTVEFDSALLMRNIPVVWRAWGRVSPVRTSA